MEEKKELLFTDTYKQKALEIVHNKGLRILQLINHHYKNLSIGNLNRKRLEEILQGNFETIEKKVWQTAEKDLQNYQSKFISDALRREVKQVLEGFKEQAGQLTKKFSEARFFGSRDLPLLAENFTIKNGEILLTDADLDYLKKEYCSVFLESIEQRKLWEKLKQAQLQLQEIKDTLNEMEVDTPLFFIQGVEPGFISETENEVILHPEEMVF
ncbi:hypothetical protein SAMN05444280_11275 [Tangfeifania diversioriginum]|uniref:Uncharacterized protein n=1 Tax=Tangfeifania diversioriginum TaxID=1168035 RepID=A0A1M6H3Z8_9BACT|nr:hypothetical protein [Tangfeifania diversioriginum]SHJ16915.1 hypothetical protein SAMN05444280_11275 [Tangfeifania diversioriginum]